MKRLGGSSPFHIGILHLGMVWMCLMAYYATAVAGFSDPALDEDHPHQARDAAFYSNCTLKDVENVCANNITMKQPDGSIIRAPGVSIWIQAHCGSVRNEHKRSMCVLSYVADDFGEDQADEFFSCVCGECPRACRRNGNLRNRQNVIAMESK